jgi:hypothetical protein
MKYFLFLFSIFSFSQSPTFQWSESFDIKHSYDIIGEIDTDLYFSFVKNNQLKFYVLDKNLTKIKEGNLSFDCEDALFQFDDPTLKQYTNLEYEVVSDKIIHLVRSFDEKKNILQIYYGLSTSDLSKKIKLNKVFEINEMDKTRRGVVISQDKSKILFFYKKKQELTYKVYDNTFTKIINEGKYIFPVSDDKSKFESFNVDNNGNIISIVSKLKEKNDKLKGFSETQYIAFITKNNQTTEPITFDFKGYDISYINCFFTTPNSVIFTGFLNSLDGNSKDKRVTSKMFFSNFSSNDYKLVNENLVNVDGLYPEKINNKDDFMAYDIKNIYYKSNGGYSVVAEQNYIYSVMTSGFNSPMVSYSSVKKYGDIAVINFKKNFEIENTTRIPKLQSNFSNVSIASTFKDDVIYVFYDDLAANFELKNEDDLKRNITKGFISNLKDRSIFSIVVQPDGKYKKHKIFDYKNDKRELLFRNSFYLKNGNFLTRTFNHIGLIKL